MAKVFLKELMPRFGLPGSLPRDDDPACVFQVMKGDNECPGHKLDLVLSLKTSITGESREIQSDLEMGLSQAMSENSRKLGKVTSNCSAPYAVSFKG